MVRNSALASERSQEKILIQVRSDAGGDIAEDGAPSEDRFFGNTNHHGTHISHRNGLVHGAESSTDWSHAIAVLSGQSDRRLAGARIGG